jgi:hypothetical protein
MKVIALRDAEEHALELLIDQSVISRYAGDLRRLGPDQDGGINYVPLDIEGVSELLTALWGRYLNPGIITAALIRLTQDGADHWPSAWCEDDEEEAWSLAIPD